MVILGISLTLLIIGYVFGRMNEAQHFASLARREADLAHITVTSMKHVPEGMCASAFVVGNVVTSFDYFKRAIATIRKIFGGEIASYTALLERARREAVVRMKTQALEHGMTHVACLRLETASVYKNAKTGIGSIEIYAYGTAVR